MRSLVGLFCALICGNLFAQIEIPSEIDAYKLIQAKVDSNIPLGATFDGGWKIEGDGAVDQRQIAKDEIVFVAPPGKYVVTFSGFWIHIKEVKFKDGDGNEIVIQSYLGHGYISEKAEVTVKGGDGPEPPDPPDPPNPAGPFQIMMFYDGQQLDSLPSSQRELLTSLSVREDLEASGHSVLEILERSAIKDGVPSKYEIWVNQVKDDPLPRIALAPTSGGRILDFPLPQNQQELDELLAKPAISSYYAVVKELSK